MTERTLLERIVVPPESYLAPEFVPEASVNASRKDDSDLHTVGQSQVLEVRLASPERPHNDGHGSGKSAITLLDAIRFPSVRANVDDTVANPCRVQRRDHCMCA